MRIAMISPHLGERFGQERVLTESSKMLRASGHQVYHLGSHQTGSFAHTDGTKLLANLNEISWRDSHDTIQTTLQAFQSQLSEWNPDLIHFIDQIDSRFMSWCSSSFPSVITAHTLAPTCPSSTRRTRKATPCKKKSGFACIIHNRFQACLSDFRNDFHRLNAVIAHQKRRKSLRGFHQVLAISQFVVDSLLLDGYEKEKVRYCPNPVATPTVSARPFRAPIVPKILCAARLVPHKGVDTLVRALYEIRFLPWTCTICGGGPELGRIQSLLDRLKLDQKIRLAGHQSFTEMEHHYNEADIYVQPNVGPEPFGLSPAEAGARGLPSIVADIPAMNEFVISNETGLLFDVGNETLLADQIQRLLSDPKLRFQLGERAQEHIQKQFSASRHLDATLQAYRSAQEEFERNGQPVNLKTMSEELIPH